MKLVALKVSIINTLLLVLDTRLGDITSQFCRTIGYTETG